MSDFFTQTLFTFTFSFKLIQYQKISAGNYEVENVLMKAAVDFGSFGQEKEL